MASTDYFKSYNSLNVHELMIKDKPRTDAYREFIESNPHLIKDKVVLDVGSGSGILSLFAARCGAKTVFAVEASEIANICEEIIAKNNYQNVISVVKGRIEDVELPEKVDVIVSEWMGFYLLHESMLDSVLYARDKWLKDDGILLPSHATIYTCPVNMSGFSRDTFEYWEDVYGFDFSPFQEKVITSHLMQPTVICLKEEQLLSDPQQLANFDLKAMKISEVQDLEDKMLFKAYKNSVLHGFAAWFSVQFCPEFESTVTENGDHQTCNGSQNNTTCCKDKSDEGSKSTNTVILDTSPMSEPTHWKQTVCFLPVTMAVEADESIHCKISLSQDDSNKRHYNISLEMREALDDNDDDDDDDDDDLSGDDDLEDQEDVSQHPVPCDCGSGRCRIIQALMEKYDAEQTELEMEAEFVDVSAEVQAAQTLDNDSTYLDTDTGQ